MNKKFLITSVCLILLLGTSVKAAEDNEVELLVTPKDISINTTEVKSVNLTVINNQESEDSFSLSVWPSTTWSGITPNLERDKVLNLGPGENSTIRLFFTVAPSADEIVTTFLVNVRSLTNNNVSDSDAVNVRVIRKTSIYISDMKLDKYLLDPADCVNITVTITNFGSDSGPYKLQTELKSGSFVIKRFDNYIDLVESASIKTISNSYCFDKYVTSGSYTIETTLKTGLNKFVDMRTTTLKIKAESNIVYDKSVVYNPFAQIKTIKIRNEGNIVEKNFYVTESVSEFVSKFFYPAEEPTISESVDDRVSYKWLIEELKPGEEKEIRYEIRFFSIWFSGLMIIIVVFFAFSYTYRPRVRKTASVIGPLKRGKEISVLLEVRNATIHEIKNVIINDTIPPIASLVEKFDTMKPSKKKTDGGIELTWKIKSLQPLEERVFTYRIKPVVDIIGSIRLPSATMSYVNKKKEKKTISSRSVEIK